MQVMLVSTVINAGNLGNAGKHCNAGNPGKHSNDGNLGNAGNAGKHMLVI